MAAGTIQEYVARRRRSRRAWITYTIPCLLLALRFIFDSAFDRLTGHIVAGLDHVTGDSVSLMALAGWLTIAYLPLAVDVFVQDRRRRLRISVLTPTSTGIVVSLTTRVRARRSHAIARQPVAYWIRRIPMVMVFVLAVLFWPLTGGSMASGWMATSGGAAFSYGWRISLVGAALGILLVLAEPWIHSRRDIRLGIRIALVVLAKIGLVVALVFA